jgi:hypothetical protein
MFIRLLARLAVLSWVLLYTAAEAASPPMLTVEYSANRRIESDQGVIEGSVAAAPGMERGEMRMGSMSTVMIVRNDLKVGYMLMPAQRMYQQLEFAQAAQASGTVAQDQVELEAVGSETLSGLETTKYKFVTKDRSAGGFLWYSAEGIPVKMDVLSKTGRDKSRMTVTLQDVRIGQQDRAAFEVPAGFTRMPGGGLFGMKR